MKRDLDCVFCKIVAGELGCIPVYEDANTLGFMDINPIAPGHTLIIPKHHAETLYDMPDDLLAHVVATTKRVASALRKALNPDGVSLIQANGKGAAQSVLHFHMHIVPRTLGDDLKINWPVVAGDMDEIREVAARVIQALD